MSSSKLDNWIDPTDYDENEICPFCIEPLGTTQAVYQTKCGHKFHNNCFNEYCENNEDKICNDEMECPYC